VTEDHCIVLNTGAKMPLIGFGTFQIPAKQAGEALRVALKTGYRHIDCAKLYDNEKELGTVFAEVFADAKSGIRREDVFVTSKAGARDIDPKKIRPCLEGILSDLKLKYLDLFLLHFPVPLENGKLRVGVGWGLQDVWRAMEACCEAGLAKAIGVSNFNSALIYDLLMFAKIPPAVNQVERHPYLTQPRLVKFCHDNGVAITGYASLGAPGLFEINLLKDPVVVAMAAEHKKTPAQILIRWSIDGKVNAIPKSVQAERIVENFSVFDFSLSPADMAKLNALNKNVRAFSQDSLGVPIFD